MEQQKDFREEQAYTAKVQQLMLALIEQADKISGSHSESIRAIIADAWEELRVQYQQLRGQRGAVPRRILGADAAVAGHL